MAKRQAPLKALQSRAPRSSAVAKAETKDALKYAREIIALEAKAVAQLGRHLNQQFEAALEAILALPPQGRVVVSGIGKAGLIGMKISSTLASTGVSSFFLHPAEAIHGDLGRFADDDIALILSNSGESEELLRMLPSVKRRGCRIILITGKTNSRLAELSDIVLSIGELAEAGPLGLAPTTSTTAMLVLGDALAMTVWSRREFSEEKFALYHPGGSLGRALTPVNQIMRRGSQHCVVREQEITKKVLHKITITKGRPGAATVVNKKGELVGIFTDGNLRRCLESGAEFLDLPIARVMTRKPRTIGHDKLAQEALGIMSELKIDQIIVVDKKRKPVGLIDIQDLVGLAVEPT